MMVNLKYGYGGFAIDATMKPMIDPDMVAKTTLKGMNHLKNGKLVITPKIYTVILSRLQVNSKCKSYHSIIFSKVMACPS